MARSSDAHARVDTSAAPNSEPFVPDDIFPADLAIVFGMTSWRRPLTRAIELYRTGTVRRLLFTGGVNPRIAGSEAVEMAKAAVAAGIDAADIIVEPLATHTAENIVNARRSIEQSIGLDNLHSVILVAIHFHMRRVRTIFADIFPADIRIGTASYPSVHYDSRDWFNSERGRQDVETENRKLKAYFEGGQWRTAATTKA